MEFTQMPENLAEHIVRFTRQRTNGDRIRAMTDEELARFLNGTDGDFLPTGEALTVSGGERCWLDWLKEEVEA